VKFVIEGNHEVNQNWINSVRSSYKYPGFVKILPRFSFSEFDQNAYQQFFQPASPHPKKLANQIFDTVKRFNFDGLVFEWVFILFVYHVRDTSQ
jgi:hypothetical protein